MNPDVLLDRVKAGGSLSDRELDEVLDALERDEAPHDVYTLLHVLWKSRTDRGRHILLRRATDADEMVRRIALQALTDRWPSDEVFWLAVERLQDRSKYVQMIAGSSVGTLGAVLPNRLREAARILVQGIDQPTDAAASTLEREVYYEGLLDLLGVPLHERPPVTRRLRAQDIDADVLRRARELAG